MELNNRQRDVLLLLAWVHLQCGWPDRAQVLLGALLQVAPKHPGARRAMVVAALEQGDWQLAEQLCLAMQAAGEQRAGLWLCLSHAQQMGGRLEEARATYRSYLQRRGAP
ncbi:tetratricopeptide repeat protein [Pseudomonas sp. MWU13-3659]|uniref:type III secretion apparatus assembly chaperone SctY n=1 Tax=Pseudomonas sp. MWU13-3659 TaxID=2986964 RepID=UPI0020765F2C|nr:tetratricopeptide repeat protein [Pseudomonas sp. MWU13-3659]